MKYLSFLGHFLHRNLYRSWLWEQIFQVIKILWWSWIPSYWQNEYFYRIQSEIRELFWSTLKLIWSTPTLQRSTLTLILSALKLICSTVYWSSADNVTRMTSLHSTNHRALLTEAAPVCRSDGVIGQVWHGAIPRTDRWRQREQENYM